MTMIQGKIRLTVSLRDQPGELVRILKPLSQEGANVHGVFHEHGFVTEDQGGKVPVEILFTLPPSLDENEKKKRIEAIKENLKKEQVEIIDFSMESVSKKFHVILIGHIFDTDARDSIHQLYSTGAQVIDMKASLKGENAESTVMFTMTYDNEETLERLRDKIHEICREKGMKYITS